MDNKKNGELVLHDQPTETTITIPGAARPALEDFTREIRAVFACANSEITITQARNDLRQTPVTEEWLLVALDLQRSIKARTGLQMNLHEAIPSLRSVKPQPFAQESAR